jgi:hypothetical protein
MSYIVGVAFAVISSVVGIFVVAAAAAAAAIGAHTETTETNIEVASIGGMMDVYCLRWRFFLRPCGRLLQHCVVFFF